MFTLKWDAGQTTYIVIVLAAIAAMALLATRAFVRSGGKKPWPAFFTSIYAIVVLLAFLYGMMAQLKPMGSGFIPLFMLASPWSWLSMALLGKSGFFVHVAPEGFTGAFLLTNFLFFVVVGGSVNSCILYLLLKRRQRRLAETDALVQPKPRRS